QRAAHHRGEGGRRPGQRLRRARRGARPRVLRGVAREDRGSVRSHRALRRTAIAVGGSEGGGAPRDDGWLARFEAALSSGDPLGASDALRKSGTNGWVRKASYDRALPVLERLRPAPLVRLKWAEPLLDLLEPALKDENEYVRKNLGPFTIGDQFLRSYPDATLARLRKWMEDPDENVRWNVAMAFAAASGARLAQRAPDILDFL